MPEAIPKADFLLQLLIAAAFVIWMILNGVKLAHLLSGKKEVHKTEVRMASELVTKEEVIIFQTQTNESLCELKESLKTIEADALERRREIYRKIEDGAEKANTNLNLFRTEFREDMKALKEDVKGLANLLTDVIRKS
jgi:hypothetical protein